MWGLQLIRNSENSNIYAGMARETAHQLGTPISALMGWVDRLKDHPDDANSVIAEIQADVGRLEQIGDRFSKMGFTSKLENISLNELIDKQIIYLKKRLPSLGKDIELSVLLSEEINILGNETLLGWAIENII